jgi:general secretion pathway protein K
LLLRQDQSLQYALAGEQFLSALLAADQTVSPDSDSLSEMWAQPTPPYPVEDGMVTGRLLDQSGKFNLNNLYHDGVVDTESLAMFERLLEQVGLQKELASAILDWQDPDDTVTGAYGAEDSFYLGQMPSRRTANQPFKDINELRFVRGFDEAENFDALARYVTVLPYFSPININTSPMQVLTAIDDAIDPQKMSDWIAQRDGQKKPVSKMDSLWDLPAFAGVANDRREKLKPLLAIKSSAYRAHISVTLSGRTRELDSLLYRQDDQIWAYQRAWVPLLVPPSEQP